MKFTLKFKEKIKDFAFEVGDMIFEARLKSGITQEALAKRMGTQQPSIARAERGSTVPSLMFLLQMSDALKTDLNPPRFTFLHDEASRKNQLTTMAATPAALVGTTRNIELLESVNLPFGSIDYSNHGDVPHATATALHRAQKEAANEYVNFGYGLPV